MKTKKIYISILFFILFFIIHAQQKSININTSKIKWTGKEVTTKSHYGSLKFQSGDLIISNGLISGGEFVVDMQSLIVEDLTGGSKEYLENHLKSDDFFDVEKYSKASLKIISAKMQKEGHQKVKGNLTIKDITNPISFDMFINENSSKADLIFDRSKFNVKHRSSSFFSNLGDKLIYDDIELEVILNF